MIIRLLGLAHSRDHAGARCVSRLAITWLASGGACLERARLLAHHPLHDRRANAESPADLQHAHAALAELQDSPFELGLAHTPALFIGAPFAVLALSTAQLDATSLGPRQPGIDAL